MKKHILLLIAILSTVLASGQTRTDSIRAALEYQLATYPASQYCDIYKNFMQDYFGPGHLLNDTVAAGRGLRNELANAKNFDGPDYEPTGFEGNFYRVNLRLVKEDVIPYQTFFEAFVNSVQGIVPPDGDTWRATWKEIDDEISALGLIFANEREDRALLAAQFADCNFVVHHSRAFDEANNFHYRIISRDNFNRLILPLLKIQ